MSKKIFTTILFSFFISTNCFASSSYHEEQKLIDQVIESTLDDLTNIFSRYYCFCFAVDENGNDIPTKGYKADDNSRAGDYCTLNHKGNKYDGTIQCDEL